MSKIAWWTVAGHLSLATILVGLGVNRVQAQAFLSNWRFDSKNQQLEFFLKEQTTPRYFLLSQPTRLVVDLPNTQLGTVATQQIYSGAVQQIRVSQFDASTTRIVMDLAPEVVLSTEQIQLQQAGTSGAGNRWLLRTQGGQTATADPTLPPVTFGDNQAVTVRVPPLGGTGATSTPSPASSSDRPSVPSVAPATPQPTPPSPTPSPLRRPSRSVPPVIEFGQPLPKE